MINISTVTMTSARFSVVTAYFFWEAWQVVDNKITRIKIAVVAEVIEYTYGSIATCWCNWVIY